LFQKLVIFPLILGCAKVSILRILWDYFFQLAFNFLKRVMVLNWNYPKSGMEIAKGETIKEFPIHSLYLLGSSTILVGNNTSHIWDKFCANAERDNA